MDEDKAVNGISEGTDKEVKTKKKFKIRFQNPVLIDKTEVPVKQAETTEEGEETTQKNPICERIKDVLKGVGLGVVSVLALGTAYVMVTNKSEYEEMDNEEPDLLGAYESEEEEESEEASESEDAPAEE